tara:strand:+ start:616 stop:924 length:309 start_codon:yes stop_codon:yes gene_type:complete
MTDKELERVAGFLFQKFLEREKKYFEENNMPETWWTNEDGTVSWHTEFQANSQKSNEAVWIEMLVKLNIEKQELIAEEKYEELIKLQVEIDEIKKLLKDNKD